MTDKLPESAYTDQEQFDQAQRKHWDRIEAWCDGCEIAYEIGDAEDMGWRCYCGGRIREN